MKLWPLSWPFATDLIHDYMTIILKDVSPLYKPAKFIEYRIRLYKKDPDEELERFVITMKCK